MTKDPNSYTQSPVFTHRSHTGVLNGPTGTDLIEGVLQIPCLTYPRLRCMMGGIGRLDCTSRFQVSRAKEVGPRTILGNICPVLEGPSVKIQARAGQSWAPRHHHLPPDLADSCIPLPQGQAVRSVGCAWPCLAHVLPYPSSFLET